MATAGGAIKPSASAPSTSFFVSARFESARDIMTKQFANLMLISFIGSYRVTIRFLQHSESERLKATDHDKLSDIVRVFQDTAAPGVAGVINKANVFQLRNPALKFGEPVSG